LSKYFFTTDDLPGLHSTEPRGSLMSEPDLATRVVRFGVFEVELRTAELRKQGVRIRLPSQSFQVLEALLLRPGELVTREELKQKLWPSDTFGDFEHGLNAAVNRVREALGDSSDNPRFVETLPRRGYRFIAPVDRGDLEADVPPESVPALPQNGQSTKADTASQPSRLSRRRWVPAVVALLLLISVGALLFVRFRDRQPADPHPTAQQDLRVVPLTTLPGQEISPSFSPDGSQVVFAWDGGNRSATNPFNLYVKVIGSEKVEQLTHEPADWIVPAWSPDGTTIAFARAGGAKEGLYSVNPRGGPERKLGDAAFDYWPSMSVSWSSDGHQLLYYSAAGLRVLTPETGEVRPVDTPGCRAFMAAFSPDGKWIAFVCGADGRFYLDLLSTRGDAPPRRLVRGECGTLAWSMDSQRVIFSPHRSRISEISINDESVHDLAFAQDDAFQAAIAPHGKQLAFVKGEEKGEIWRLDPRTGLARSVFASASVEQDAPDFSPDGKRIAFESGRSGFHEVWVANLDGSDAIQLSNFHERQTGTPRWSPDGHRIVFDSQVTGKPALYLVDPATALPKQIATDNLPASVPSWSSDGKWIYFTSGSAPEHGFLYKVAPEGGTPERLTQTRGYDVKQSRDGRFLYFFAGSDNADIRVLDLASGHEQALPGMPKVVYPTDWTLGSKGIFFVDWGQKPSIDFYDFGLQRVTRKVSLDRQPDSWGGLSLSADETWLAYTQMSQNGSDLMLVEGFR
jgi:Tol biopolymer transport system component/DNA-binding winged helix-turn-helix (wHTH) protein